MVDVFRAKILAAGLLALSVFVSGTPVVAQQSLQLGDVVARSSSKETGFRIITKKGSVAFTIPNSWIVLDMRSQPPISVIGLQVPNSADQGTSQSTNFGISLFDLDSENARKVRSAVGTALGTAMPATSRYKEWIIYSQKSSQGKTAYTVSDAVRDLPGIKIAVSVRLAWPHLRNNKPGYDAQITQAFYRLLDSITSTAGSYVSNRNDVVRRSTP